MTDKKSSVGEVLGVILVIAFFALIYGPIVLFEMNEHSGVRTEYEVTKIGWLVYPVTAGDYRDVTIRNAATARVTGTYRGVGYSALTDQFYIKNIPTDLVKDRRYEFHLRCTKVGMLPNPAIHDLCNVLSVKERSGARIVQADDPRLIER
jgi:hypothetical protein